MRICFAVHAWPDEAVGGTELHARALARALVRRGHEVTVFAGSLRRAPAVPGASGPRPVAVEDETLEPGLELLRVRRGDLYFDHWHKGLEPAVGSRWRALLEAERPDVVHVHHWLRLSSDLVLAAARAGVPAVISLHDHFAGCPLVFRLRPDTRDACAQPAGPHPCVGCAGRVAPRTPWVETGEGYVRFAERQAGLARELELARAIAVPSESHRQALGAALGRELPARVLPPAHLERLPEPPAPPPPPSAVDGARPLVLGSWSGDARHKGRERLLAAATELAARGIPIELRLAGGGDPPEPEPAARDGLALLRLGRFEPGSLARHPVARCHAMVAPGAAPESYGLVHDEALALGLPAVLSDRGALSERADRGAVLFDPAVEGALTAVLLELLAPGRLKALRAEALAARAAVPTVDDAAEIALALYDEALRAGPPAAEALPPEDWFAARMTRFRTEQWDASLSRASPAELGFA